MLLPLTGRTRVFAVCSPFSAIIFQAPLKRAWVETLHKSVRPDVLAFAVPRYLFK